MKTLHTLLAIAALTVGAAAPAAAQRSHIGFHAAYDFDIEEALIGAQVHIPIASRVELYPSFDYYFVDPQLLGFNVDLKFHPRASSLYLGGGLSILDSDSGSDTGGNLFLGVESRRGSVHPQFEARLKLHDQSQLQLGVGLNFTLF